MPAQALFDKWTAVMDRPDFIRQNNNFLGAKAPIGCYIQFTNI